MVKLVFRAILFLIVVGAYATVVRGSSEVHGVRLWAAPDNTRVVLDLSGPTEHTLFTLKSPDRVVIDVRRGEMDARAVDMPGGDGFVQRIRSAPQPNGDLRVVLDLNQRVQPRSFTVPPNDVYGHRLVIDLAVPRSHEPVKTVIQRPSTNRAVIVAIDPGHGGEDPGAVGRGGTREKDVVLQISRRLAKEIDREPGMQALLIRNGDYFLSLRHRMERARAEHADLFVSIHADAFKDRRASGSSVYVLSQRGASDEAARWLAERENASDLIGGVALSDKDDVLASVLLDLSQNASISASMTAGERVLYELDKVSQLHKSRVQHAGFAVLKSPDIPSILVETAFISNPKEERNLGDPKHQTHLATAIFAGVREYLYENAPPDTLIAARAVKRTDPVKYVIGRGDTLSTIAVRYNVSVRSLKRANGLKNDRIRIGQILTIPMGTGT